MILILFLERWVRRPRISNQPPPSPANPALKGPEMIPRCLPLGRGFNHYRLQPDSTPDETGHPAPKGGQDAITPVDDADMLPAVEGSDYLVGHLSGTKHHGVTEVAAEADGAVGPPGERDVLAITCNRGEKTLRNLSQKG